VAGKNLDRPKHDPKGHGGQGDADQALEAKMFTDKIAVPRKRGQTPFTGSIDRFTEVLRGCPGAALVEASSCITSCVRNIHIVARICRILRRKNQQKKSKGKRSIAFISRFLLL